MTSNYNPSLWELEKRILGGDALTTAELSIAAEALHRGSIDDKLLASQALLRSNDPPAVVAAVSTVRNLCQAALAAATPGHMNLIGVLQLIPPENFRSDPVFRD